MLAPFPGRSARTAKGEDGGRTQTLMLQVERRAEAVVRRPVEVVLDPLEEPRVRPVLPRRRVKITQLAPATKQTVPQHTSSS